MLAWELTWKATTWGGCSYLHFKWDVLHAAHLGLDSSQARFRRWHVRQVITDGDQDDALLTEGMPKVMRFKLTGMSPESGVELRL